MLLYDKCLFFLLIFVLSAVRAEPQAPIDDTSLISNGLQILTRVTRQYLKSQPDDVLLSEGVHLIRSKAEGREAKALEDDKTFFGNVQNYLTTHEVRIKLPDLVPSEGIGRAFKEALEEFDDKAIGTGRKGGGGGGGGGGGKGGGGMGGLLLVGAMMAKLLAALGLGGVGLLAMKALMVSALALMLSAIIGLKKLVHSGHEESGHTVIHAGGHEHRKKREAANLAYKAWSPFAAA